MKGSSQAESISLYFQIGFFYFFYQNTVGSMVFNFSKYFRYGLLSKVFHILPKGISWMETEVNDYFIVQKNLEQPAEDKIWISAPSVNCT